MFRPLSASLYECVDAALPLRVAGPALTTGAAGTDSASSSSTLMPLSLGVCVLLALAPGFSPSYLVPLLRWLTEAFGNR